MPNHHTIKCDQNLVSFTHLKKIAVIRELDYEFCIDEDGYGYAVIDGVRIEFVVNAYGDVDLDTVHYVR